MKKNIIGLSLKEIEQEVESLGEKSFRAKQLWHWIYDKGVTSFDHMTSIKKDLQQKLDEHFSLERIKLEKVQKSIDGTQKFLLKTFDNNFIETVFIPEENRGTICLSSQIGCLMGCKFCYTGTQKMIRNLSAGEIINQILIIKDKLQDWNNENQEKIVNNIVLMGMGEPLQNYENVKKSVQIIMDENGLNFSKRKITLSTSGIVPKIAECGQDLDINLAISLHATTDTVRSQIMPINKKYNLKQVLDACRNYAGVKNSRRITFEYIMIKDLNDTKEDATRLANLLKGIPAKINLIPFNPWPEAVFEPSSNNRVHLFSDYLNSLGYSAPIRKQRGEDILAACGQLLPKK